MRKIILLIGILVLTGCAQPLNIEAAKGTWKPSTKAYTALGNLTISDNTIAWSSGQKASFRVITQDKYDIIVELEGATYKYLKLTPKDNLVDLEKEDLRVTFYEASQGLDDKNVPQAIYTRHYKDK